MFLSLFFSLQVNELYSAYKRGGTGQKSRTSILLLNMRSMGRLVTSIHNWDSILVLCYGHACLWNTLITLQAAYYTHKRKRIQMREERKRREVEEEARLRSLMESSSSDSDNTDSEGRRLSPRHRRRRCNAGFPLIAGN